MEIDNQEVIQTYTFERKVFVPGYLRGLTFVGTKYAVVGCSQDRHDNTFKDLALGDTLTKLGVSAKCGIFVIDLHSWDIIHNITFYSPVTEIYDICSIPNITRPHLEDVADDKLSRKYCIEY